MANEVKCPDCGSKKLKSQSRFTEKEKEEYIDWSRLASNQCYYICKDCGTIFKYTAN